MRRALVAAAAVAALLAGVGPVRPAVAVADRRSQCIVLLLLDLSRRADGMSIEAFRRELGAIEAKVDDPDRLSAAIDELVDDDVFSQQNGGEVAACRAELGM